MNSTTIFNFAFIALGIFSFVFVIFDLICKFRHKELWDYFDKAADQARYRISPKGVARAMIGVRGRVAPRNRKTGE